MKVARIPNPSLTACVALLRQGVPELDEVKLVQALQSYESTPEPAADPERGRLLKPTEAARLLGVSRRKIFALIKDGTLHPVRLGKRTTRVALSEIERLTGDGEART